MRRLEIYIGPGTSFEVITDADDMGRVSIETISRGMVTDPITGEEHFSGEDKRHMVWLDDEQADDIAHFILRR